MQVYVRVELHGATTVAQYERLHRAMEGAGFERTIPGGQGGVWELPTASYFSTRYANVQQVRDAAWQAAKGITPTYAVIAAGNAIAWDGLKQLK